jgi:hypothetical protein
MPVIDAHAIEHTATALVCDNKLANDGKYSRDA